MCMIAKTRLAGRAGAVAHALNVHAPGGAPRQGWRGRGPDTESERLARDGIHGVPVSTKRMDAANGRFTLWPLRNFLSRRQGVEFAYIKDEFRQAWERTINVRYTSTFSKSACPWAESCPSCIAPPARSWFYYCRSHYIYCSARCTTPRPMPGSPPRQPPPSAVLLYLQSYGYSLSTSFPAFGFCCWPSVSAMTKPRHGVTHGWPSLLP